MPGKNFFKSIKSILLYWFPCNSPWMYVAQASMDHALQKGASWASLGKNSELRLLFDRMSEIGRLPINAVFVFDGPKCPSKKRSTAVGAADHYMTQDFKAIIKGFGHMFHDVLPYFMLNVGTSADRMIGSRRGRSRASLPWKHWCSRHGVDER